MRKIVNWKVLVFVGVRFQLSNLLNEHHSPLPQLLGLSQCLGLLLREHFLRTRHISALMGRSKESKRTRPFVS